MRGAFPSEGVPEGTPSPPPLLCFDVKYRISPPHSSAERTTDQREGGEYHDPQHFYSWTCRGGERESGKEPRKAGRGTLALLHKFL